MSLDWLKAIFTNPIENCVDNEPRRRLAAARRLSRSETPPTAHGQRSPHENHPLIQQMNTLPLTPEIAAVSRRVIWFEEPEQAIAGPARFVAYAMTYGTHEDMAVIRRHLSEEDLREALSQSPPGIFDGRSWAYWNLKLGHYPTPPMPQRDLSAPVP